MKKLIFAILILGAFPVYGQSISDCIGSGIRAEQADLLCGAKSIDECLCVQ